MSDSGEKSNRCDPAKCRSLFPLLIVFPVSQSSAKESLIDRMKQNFTVHQISSYAMKRTQREFSKPFFSVRVLDLKILKNVALSIIQASVKN